MSSGSGFGLSEGIFECGHEHECMEFCDAGCLDPRYEILSHSKFLNMSPYVYGDEYEDEVEGI